MSSADLLRRTVGWAVLVGLVVAKPVRAQDVEITSLVSGRALPAQYFERVGEHPDFFEIEGGWSARESALDGTLPVVVVQALFADSPVPFVSPSEIQALLFDGPSTFGTLTEYYGEVSGGSLQLQGQVLPWVRTDLTVAETVGASFGLGDDARTGDFLVDALARADGTTDFGQFDNDGLDGIPNSGDDDGIVDALALQFIEIAASCGNGAIWPHRARVSNWLDAPFATDDLRPDGTPVMVDDYIMQSTVRCNGVDVQTVTTFAHELGHVLGLPDFYDRMEGLRSFQRNWVVGCWSLMAAGTWGCGPALFEGRWVRPTHMGPYEKAALGWLTDLEVVGDVRNAEFTLGPVESGGKVLQVPVSASEYYLVEYRGRGGFDVDLPAAGVVIYRVDEKLPQQRCRSCPTQYHVQVVEADANGTLVRPEPRGGSRGEATDIFAGTPSASFTNLTVPSTRLNSGAASPVTFYEITVSNGEAHLRLSTTTVPLETLLQEFLGGPTTPMTDADRTYLDQVGNNNGRYDVGDLRRYLREHPTVLIDAGYQP